MNLLAIDTSSVACSVALQHGGDVAERHEEQAREHTRLLVPMIQELLQQASVELMDLDAIVLGNGPGSFIGMRIAASVAQGLAFGSGLEIVHERQVELGSITPRIVVLERHGSTRAREDQ